MSKSQMILVVCHASQYIGHVSFGEPLQSTFISNFCQFCARGHLCQGVMQEFLFLFWYKWYWRRILLLTTRTHDRLRKLKSHGTISDIKPWNHVGIPDMKLSSISKWEKESELKATLLHLYFTRSGSKLFPGSKA